MAESSSMQYWFNSFEAKATEVEQTPEQYLQLTTQCMEEAEMLISPQDSDSKSIQVKFNYEQCKYLVKKLRRTIYHVNRFFSHFEFHKSTYIAPENQARCLALSKILFLLAKEVLCFIQDCSKEHWIQGAIILWNTSDHVLSLGFNLELCAIFFYSFPKSCYLTLQEVSDLKNVEVKFAKEKAAFIDHGTLLTNVKALIDSYKGGKGSIDEYELATFLFKKLNGSRPQSPPLDTIESLLQLNLCERSDMTSLKEMVKIAKGGFGIVYKAIWWGMEVAVKTFHGPENPDFKKEVSICAKLSHPNVTSLFFYGMDCRECSLVMELMDEDLQSLIRTRLRGNQRRKSPFCLFVALDIMLQIGEGMSYLHKMEIVHRDLKSQNILVRCMKPTKVEEHEYLQVKVADFGLSRTKEKSMTYSNQTPNIGTTRWMAPEMFKYECNIEEERYPFKSDVYSFAMVCYEILTGKFPFSNVHSDIEVKRKVRAGDRPHLPDQCPVKLETLIEKCWSKEAIARPSFPDICLELRYVKNLQMLGEVGSVFCQFYDYFTYMSRVSLFKRRLQELLVVHAYNIPLKKFIKFYRQRFYMDLDLQYFGATSLDALLHEVTDVALLLQRIVKGETKFYVVARRLKSTRERKPLSEFLDYCTQPSGSADHAE